MGVGLEQPLGQGAQLAHLAIVSTTVHGKCMESAWEVHGKCMGSTWEVHDKYMVSTWQVNSRYIVRHLVGALSSLTSASQGRAESQLGRPDLARQPRSSMMRSSTACIHMSRSRSRSRSKSRRYI